MDWPRSAATQPSARHGITILRTGSVGGTVRCHWHAIMANRSVLGEEELRSHVRRPVVLGTRLL